MEHKIQKFREKLNELAERQAECMQRIKEDPNDKEAILEFNRIRFACFKAYNVLEHWNLPM